MHMTVALCGDLSLYSTSFTQEYITCFCRLRLTIHPEIDPGKAWSSVYSS
ncbi:MAG TPA: hypothetical protein VFN35_13770 [Ktedonobacteraceae bacterium]|nr:hypothetical protein [Ktedonobacteraceae bacterium]